MGIRSTGEQPTDWMDTDEKYHNIFAALVRALQTLALNPERQCITQGDFNVAQELQYEVLAGRYVIGRGKLSHEEEQAIASLATVVERVSTAALKFAEGHEANVINMRHPDWAPIRIAAASLVSILQPRIVETTAYFAGDYV